MKNLMWGARFFSDPSEASKKINFSINFDRNLYKQDIKASIAHCKMLAKQSIITNEEKEKIISGLDFSTAIDVANWLVKSLNIPFRDSHKITERIIKLAEEKKCKLCELDLVELQKIEPRITGDIFSVISVDNSVLSKASYGGTSSNQVLEIFEKAKLYLEDNND